MIIIVNHLYSAINPQTQRHYDTKLYVLYGWDWEVNNITRSTTEQLGAEIPYIVVPVGPYTTDNAGGRLIYR